MGNYCCKGGGTEGTRGHHYLYSVDAGTSERHGGGSATAKSEHVLQPGCSGTANVGDNNQKDNYGQKLEGSDTENAGDENQDDDLSPGEESEHETANVGNTVQGQTIKIDDGMRLIKIPSPSYKGYLIQRTGEIKVYRAQLLTDSNMNEMTVQVHYYSSIPPAFGTYVVLRFKKSGRYLAANKDNADKLVALKPVRFEPNYAKDITTTADRRVFLMITHSSEVLFMSMYASEKLGSSHVITVSEDADGSAELQKEGTPPSEAQRFKLEYY